MTKATGLHFFCLSAYTKNSRTYEREIKVDQAILVRPLNASLEIAFISLAVCYFSILDYLEENDEGYRTAFFFFFQKSV